jgi:hypothetical protein
VRGPDEPVAGQNVGVTTPTAGRPAPATAAVAAGRAFSPRPFSPRTALRPLVGFFATGLGLSALYATTGIGVDCPFRVVTGWECPLCGGTRMGSALLHGDVPAAFAYNPVALLGIVVLGVVGVLWVVEALGGRAVRPPAAVRDRWRRTSQTQRLLGFLVLATVYTVVRNLL